MSLLGMTNFFFFWHGFHGFHGFFSFGGTWLRSFGYMLRYLKRGKLLLSFGRIDTYQGSKSQLAKGLQFLGIFFGTDYTDFFSFCLLRSYQTKVPKRGCRQGANDMMAAYFRPEQFPDIKVDEALASSDHS